MGSTQLQNKHCYGLLFEQGMLQGRTKLVIKIARRVKEKAVKNKLSFSFSVREENKYYCRLFLWLFCGPGVLSFSFLLGKCLW